MSVRELIIEGARQNNLRNINLRLPHNKVIAITGVSGSGKSSLAFDTIFAEGQWRFIESISSYARLFIEKLDRPELDAIHNIRPAIALEQKNPVRGTRSTVGTLTELYDLLRILYSKVSDPLCPKCGREVRKWDPGQITTSLLSAYCERKALIVFQTDEPIDEIMKRGYHRLLLGNEVVEAATLNNGQLAGMKNSDLYVVLDRLVIKDSSRLSDSIETAWREGNECISVVLLGSRPGSQNNENRLTLSFSSANTCDECGVTLPEPSPLLFSFNHPVGACPACKGFGNILKYDEDLIVPDKDISLAEGAIDPWEKPGYAWWRRQFISGARKAGINIRKPYMYLSQEEIQKIYRGGPEFYGIDAFFNELEAKRYKLHVRVFLSRYRNAIGCPACCGKRLREEALAYKIGGYAISQLCDMPLSLLAVFFKDIYLSSFQRDLAKEILRQIENKLSFLKRVGLSYLTLSREGKTLSGGEYQRVNLSTQLASCLTGTLYVLDEPTVGLHARDTERVSNIMSELSKTGNTVIVVEHDKEIIGAADWIVELGPGGGREGGEVVFSGQAEGFLKADTMTSRYLRGLERLQTKDAGAPLPYSKKSAGPGLWTKDCLLTLSGAKGNNLKDIDMKIPLHKLTAITGVSGSGKSSLIIETLYRALARHFKAEHDSPLPYAALEGIEAIKGVRIIDQSPVGRSPRSNPATYLKIFDNIRKLYSEQPEALAHGYTPGFFSFNVPGGRCETCKGEGFQKLEMYFFEDVYVTCDECNGRQYGPEALSIFYKDKTITDVLNMTVDDAAVVFGDNPGIISRLKLLKEMGLGYMRLGQSATTLSGGEAQRLKICHELGSERNVDFLYILDEPTVGLHFKDVRLLLQVISRLVNAGNTVIIIEHNLDVIGASDWIIDLGPEGGDNGGRIIFEGRPADIIKDSASCTGKYLKAVLQS